MAYMHEWLIQRGERPGDLAWVDVLGRRFAALFDGDLISGE